MVNDKMNLDGKSLDITKNNLAKLKQLFPNLVKEGDIDLNELKATFGKEPDILEERYGLNWAGKYEAFKQIQEQTTHTLHPDRSNSIEFDDTQNIFIEGENLEVLKILQKSYYGKIKMIYIDPPYNTGNDHFIYPDKYGESKAEYLYRTGDTDEQGYLNKAELFRKNSRENGHFHSVWLSMMYPRLYLARNLLKEDGVIFVSIDDNEVANLRLLMDDVFGEENFVVQIIWKKRSTPPNDKIIGAIHDYILVYSKNIELKGLNLKERTKKQLARYKNPDNHPKGPWAPGDLMANVKGGRYVPSLYFAITNPKTGQKHYPSSNGNWRFNKKKVENLIKNNEIYFGDNGEGRPKLKRFLADVKSGTTYSTLWDFVPFNQSGSSEISNLLGNMNIFDNPKPGGLITEVLKLGSNKDAIILDFFAGSCTTAHAVLALNKEDGGNRKFICIQLPEATDEKSEAYKAGYKNIAAIGRARIKKVIDKMNAERATRLALEPRPTLGFRAFSLIPSNFKIWRSDLEDEEDVIEQLEFHQQVVKKDDKEAMLWELLLKTGYPLSTPIENKNVDGATVHFINNGELIIALHALNPNIVTAIRQAKPNIFICLDALFNNDDQLKTNISLQFEEEGVIFKAI